jgi:hypothetical protein
MATKYSQVPVGNIFEAGGGKFRKIDDLYYEDIYTGIESMWNPMFDETISNLWDAKDVEADTNTTDKFLVDTQTRVMKPNPNYQTHQLCAAERTFAEMWGTAEYDCGPEEYDYMAMVSVPAVGAMKELAKLVGFTCSLEDVTKFPTIVEILTVAYEEYKKNSAAPYEAEKVYSPAIMATVSKKKAAKKPAKASKKKAVAKKAPAKKAAKKAKKK